MRVCWNRQTGTFEGRVSSTYGFKSRLPHQVLARAAQYPTSFCGVGFFNSAAQEYLFHSSNTIAKALKLRCFRAFLFCLFLNNCGFNFMLQRIVQYVQTFISVDNKK